MRINKYAPSIKNDKPKGDITMLAKLLCSMTICSLSLLFHALCVYKYNKKHDKKTTKWKRAAVIFLLLTIISSALFIFETKTRKLSDLMIPDTVIINGNLPVIKKSQ